ncbi:DUF724 domain-containing protein 7-like [Mercurialis annua]|uniref:DUF724 domain-containing protein 7-like n=1 Tax=Mercurialis annua TaxID=3986 RepID=UPI00215E2F6C|nr:DUF724 domain-containing protein 7-like [Mercurialis annua]
MLWFSQQLSKAGEDTVEDTTKQNSFDEIAEVELTAKELDLTVSAAHSVGGERTKTSCQVPGKEISLHNDEEMNWQQKGKEYKTAGNSMLEMDYEACATEEVELLGVACSGLTGYNPGSGVKQNQVNDTSVTSMQSPVVNVGVSCQLVENGDTPFEKCSPLWEKIDSQEVFRAMPQRPHFRTLMRYKKLNREGLALGNMINFASLVEKTCKLQVDDPRDVMNSYLDALSELEIHGFDVKPVAKRLNELVLMKDRQEELQNRLKENETEFTKVNSEKTNTEKEIDALDEEIRMLKERQAMNKSMKVCNDSKIASLDLDDSVLSEHISKAQQEFESLATSSW